MPNFDIAIGREPDPLSGKFQEDVLVITNTGAPAREVFSEVLFFLNYDGNAESSQKYTSGLMPLNGYYSSAEISTNSKGVLAKYFGYRNVERLLALKSNSMELAKNRHADVNFIPETYVRIKYLDEIGERHEEFYKVESVGGAVGISVDSWNKLEHKWSTSHIPDIESITPNELVARAMAGA
jgi:hypothetical protein